MKKIISILLIAVMLTSVLGVTAFAGSYEEYMLRFNANRSTNQFDYYAYLMAEKYAGEKIPALMYHKITDNPDEVTDYVVTGDMLVADFNEIRARGYTPIFVSEYFDLVNAYIIGGNDNYNKITQFFEENRKPIIITFDDGYEGIYTHALPLMKEYGFKVNFYICGQLIDELNPEYCTWEEIKLLSESGLAEIGNHTYGLHRYLKDDLRNLYTYDLYTAIDDINFNRDTIRDKIGVESKAFSFPYGLYDNYVLTILKSQGYNAFISTDYRANSINKRNVPLGRFNRPASYTTKDFFDMIERYL